MSPLTDGSAPEPPRMPPASEMETVAPGEGGPRRHPSTIGGICYLVVLGVAVVAFVVIAANHWRFGVHLLAGALIAGAVARLALPERDAGMLAVRNRWLDGGVLAVFGAALWFLATTLPQAA